MLQILVHCAKTKKIYGFGCHHRYATALHSAAMSSLYRQQLLFKILFETPNFRLKTKTPLNYTAHLIPEILIWSTQSFNCSITVNLARS